MSEPLNQKPIVTVTPSGAVVFWLSFFAVPIGVFTYSGPVLVLGVIGMIFLALSRWLAFRQMKGLRLLRRLPKRGFPGETFEMETVLENRRGFLASREIQMDDRLAGHGGTGIRFPSVEPGGSVSTSDPAKVFQRGRLRVSQFHLNSCWPFGFFKASLKGRFEPMPGENDSMLVAPKPVMPRFVNQMLQKIEQEAVLYSELTPDDLTEFRSLREFRSGDSLQSIHWPATSRSSSIIVREFDPPLPRPCLLYTSDAADEGVEV